MQLLLKP